MIHWASFAVGAVAGVTVTAVVAYLALWWLFAGINKADTELMADDAMRERSGL